MPLSLKSRKTKAESEMCRYGNVNHTISACSSMVEFLLPKQKTRDRYPLRAPRGCPPLKTQYRELVRKSRSAGRWPAERALGISTTFKNLKLLKIYDIINYKVKRGVQK